jgi:hypothetical protein
MKLCLSVIVAFLVMINVAWGAVGDGGVSDGSSYIKPEQSYLAGTALQGTGLSSPGPQTVSASASLPYQSGSYQEGTLQPQGNQLAQNPQLSSSPEIAAYSAPQITGPYQERMSAEELKFATPQAESFRPDGSLNFVSSTPPSELNAKTYSTSKDAITGSGSWFYPGSVVSSNKFFVQTASGLGTVGGCSYGGYLPLWADINSGGNFFVYEWYPGQNTPSVRWWGWTWTGFKKGWFSGDVPGWHILSYNCRDWSNYIYIYVFPESSSGPSASYGYMSNPGTMTLPKGAPTPPNPNAESLAIPDFNLYKPTTGQMVQVSYSGYAAQTSYPAQGSYQGRASYPTEHGLPMQADISTGNCPTCNSPDAARASGSTSPTGICPTCTASANLNAPYGYAPESYKAVYPVPSTCRCNEFYVQTQPGKLGTVAGVFYGEWLPLWSKVSRSGVYWSSEWMICKNQKGYYCPPEVRNFGYKNTGWYQTWFRGNNPGWHILSYYCNDWSNYIYIYVWPAN